MYKIIVIVFVLVIVISCDTARMFTPSTIKPPIAPGIFMTDCDGNTLGTWMDPYSPSYQFPNSSPHLLPITMKCFAYPNPDNGHMTISFSIPYQSNGKITVYPALSYLDDLSEPVNYFGSTYYYSNSDPVKTLHDGNLNNGSHAVTWNGCYDDENYAPDGFYRVYLDFDEHLVWVDVLLIRDINNLPPDMYFGGMEW